jgi:tetrahydromethanopterin S-methyltransferase subunit G
MRADMKHLILRMGLAQVADGAQNAEIDRINARLDRIERRLQLTNR